MKKRQFVIHPGMIEAPRVFVRAEKLLRARGHEVTYHACQSHAPEDYDPETVHIVHSGGFICSKLLGKSQVFLIAPCTTRSHERAFFTQFGIDIKDSFVRREWSMFWYKNLSALGELLFNFPYWNRMRVQFVRHQPPLPASKLIILHPHDPWDKDFNWSDHTTVEVPGQHDEIVYRPERILAVIFDKLEA